MNRHISEVGNKYGRLTIMSDYTQNGRWYCHCLCDCGNEHDAMQYKIKSGHTSSCGCLLRDNIRKATYKHGLSKTRIFRLYSKMIRRCYVTEEPAYKYYGARGIKVCDEWLQDRRKFFEWAFEHGYSDNLTIERIDVNGDYEPNNCKWISFSEQARNRRSNVYIECFGKRQILNDWCEEYHINQTTFRNRLKRGWSIEDALTKELDTTRRNGLWKGVENN